MALPILSNEIFRINELNSYAITDTEYDLNFDNLVEIASAYFSTPIALVSIVDSHRQWFKAKVGLDVRQTPRGQSFCTHAIMRPGEVMVVEDARNDRRFHGNPLVELYPHIRFYAGAPIVTDSGAALGTFCVIDREPRSFSAADRVMLARFANSALSMLELHRRNALLHDAAKRDFLTGLLNRRGLDDTLDRAIGSALNGQTCALLYLDLDHFKHVNDSFGHHIGDKLLKEVGRRLQGVVRDGDVVARIGGDEFAVFLAHPVDLTALEFVAQKVLQTCCKSVMLKGHAITPGVTIGGALSPRDAITPNDLLRAADAALYAAKRSGRGQFMIVGNDNPNILHNEIGLEKDLSRAIDQDELFLEWQSCHDITTGDITGYEALVRWQHPELGRLAPDHFVSLAEACGIALRLDTWVIHQAFHEAVACARDCYFSVNLSAQTIAAANVVPLVAAALHESGMCPDKLVLEITETTAIPDEDAAKTHISALRAMGVRIALDDFGTGYSALTCLQTYAFDLVKLDSKFVAATGASERGHLVAEGVIRLARSLDIGVVAEGIETPAQAALLSKLGCGRAQGFLWARPVRAPWLDPVAEPAPGNGSIHLIAHDNPDLGVAIPAAVAPPSIDSGDDEPRSEPKPLLPVPHDDRRGLPRFRTILIVAKLIVDGHERFCLIRDASTSGLKIKLFSPLPDHDRLAVELANGRQYQVRCVWSVGENAGLQFLDPITLEYLLDYASDANRRRHMRLRIALTGMLRFGDKTAPVTLRDISQHGASIETERWLLIDELVKIETAIFPVIYAKVRWRNHPHYGVIFEETFRLEELALKSILAE